MHGRPNLQARFSFRPCRHVKIGPGRSHGERAARAYYGSLRGQSPHLGSKGKTKSPDRGSGGHSSLEQRAFVKFSIQFFHFLTGMYSFNFIYKSFAEDQKNNLKFSCKADKYSLLVRGKQRSTIENWNADER